MGTRFLLVLVCLLFGAQAASPQGDAVLRGRVTDRSTGKSIPSADIALLGDRRKATSDSVGNYVFTGLPTGVSQLVIRAANFPTLTIIVELEPNQVLLRPIVLDSTAEARAAQTMPTVAVTAAAPVINYRLVDFERRKKTGRGHYLTEDEIIRGGANSLHDAVRTLRGVSVSCGGFSCRIQMVRAPMHCPPDYVVDGRIDNMFGATTPIRDIVAIEVYTGAADVPGEFAGSTAGCGVVVMWTRSGPARR